MGLIIKNTYFYIVFIIKNKTMKKCPKCNADVNDNFDICWNCQYSFVEQRVLQNSDFELICPSCNAVVGENDHICPYCKNDLGTGDRPEKETAMSSSTRYIECLRCQVAMEYRGYYNFHEGASAGLTANFLDLFTNREAFELYVCPNCGKVEFFIPGYY